jgi:hypothetical protein
MGEKENSQIAECPLCHATVVEGQRKCLFCGTILDTSTKEKPEPVIEGQSERFFLSLLGFIAVGAIVLSLVIARMSPLANRTLVFVGLLLLVHAFVALFIWADARRLHISRHEYGAPWKWALATLVAMPFVVVFYSAVRVRCGAKDFTRAALVLGGFWFAAVVYAGYVIRQEPVLPPAVARQLDEQLSRTLDAEAPKNDPLSATVSSPH